MERQIAGMQKDGQAPIKPRAAIGQKNSKRQSGKHQMTANKNESYILGLGWFNEGDEERFASMGVEEDGSVWIDEYTSGELTQFVYGNEQHHHQIRLSEYAMRQLARHFGVAITKSPGVIQRLFSPGGYYLSDLMDLLEDARIEYSYTSFAGKQGVLR